MAVKAPAIVDVRPSGANVTLGLPAWLRGIGVRQVRFACGLVMFSYIFSHFFNHALGNISYATMEWWLSITSGGGEFQSSISRSTPRLPSHFSLGLWALYQRRHFRYAGAEITQLVLGLSIPLWLASHFGAVRIAGLDV